MSITEYPWWHGAAIYQIYPRSFNDTSGNGVGDLNGIVAKLEYIADLGVDGIWISPFFLSPMKDFGYDVADYCAVDPIFGQLSDFKNLIEKAHSLGLKVIIDQVYSHTSDQHDWFKQSQQDKTNHYADWYVWADPKADGSPPNNWLSVFGGSSWTWDNRRKQYYLHNFLSSQPDLNLRHPDVQQALFDAAKFWLELGVDGFRLDAINFGMHDPQLTDNPAKVVAKDAPHYRPFALQTHKYNVSQPAMVSFLEKLRTELDNFDAIFTVAEVGGENPVPVMKAYVKGNNRLHSAYSFEFLIMPELDKSMFKQALIQWDNNESAWPAWAFSNHDAPRSLSRWGGDDPSPQKAKLFLLLLAALRGNVFVYQGEELGLLQSDVPFEKLQDPEAIANWPDNMGRDGARTPIPWQSDAEHFGFSDQEPWLPIDLHAPTVAADIQAGDLDSVLNFAKQAFALRKHSKCLRHGSLELVELDKNLIAFTREYDDEGLLCLFNHTDHRVKLDLSLFSQRKRVLATNTASNNDDTLLPFAGVIFALGE